MKNSVNFETLAKVFMKLVDERYPSAEKILQHISTLVPGNNSIQTVNTKIMYTGMMRRAVKEVSPNHVYRSIQHRDDLYNAIIEASEQLEDILEELEEAEAEQESETS